MRPLFLDADSDQWPLYIVGSCILAKVRSQAMVVTALHCVGESHSGRVRVMISNRTRDRLPLSQGFGQRDFPNGADVDLIAYPASLASVKVSDLNAVSFVKLESVGLVDWQSAAAVSRFYVTGYPHSGSEIHYGLGLVTVQQVTMPASYVARWPGMFHMHTLRVEDSQQLESFSGFSGGAVFCFERQVGAAAVSRFCGVVVQGSPQSGLVHFVDARQVLQVGESAFSHVGRFGLKLARKLKKFEG